VADNLVFDADGKLGDDGGDLIQQKVDFSSGNNMQADVDSVVVGVVDAAATGNTIEGTKSSVGSGTNESDDLDAHMDDDVEIDKNLAIIE